MIRAIKSYWAFTKRIYRLVVLILFPLLAVGCTVVAGVIDKKLMGLAIVGYYVFFMIAEPLSDFWFLGGFYSKNKGALEFMQSSSCFQSVIRDVVVVDLVRRVALNGVIFLVMICIGVVTEVNPEGYVLFAFFPLLEILLGEVVVLIGRHFDFWNHYYVVVLIGFMIAALFMAKSIISWLNYLEIICAVIALLAVVTAVITIHYTNKKVRDSYYD